MVLFFFFEKTNYLATVSVNDPSICSLPSLITPLHTPCTPSISRNPTLSTLGLPYSTLWWRWKWFSNNLICDHSTCCLFMKTIFMILISSLQKWKQMFMPEISSKHRPCIRAPCPCPSSSQCQGIRTPETQHSRGGGREIRVQSHPQLCSKFKANLGYIRPCLQKLTYFKTYVSNFWSAVLV